ncbi:hypothetical protein [Pasteurella multocida]|uniref:hypothetical protein n=1 Tax=Pasteurella multocida TaxID=747 RepID=UPI0028DDEC3D|nr:hypothetical protein [Pasteurella multocida]HDR1103245.1 hypothetical protein [Pasteurella multocida]HDR1155217.1 hypothetical protein [Pasteurella multocida]HDR1164773.1 hypothetical protein [Pasteurella multocida]HDR1166092.1 hypothetical protein [Pasteurella multocida]
MKKQADETKELQNSLKSLLQEVGWSKKELAKEIVDDLARSGSPDYRDEQTEYEKIKKLLSRPTTKPETLLFYINFIITHKETKKYNFIKHPEVNLNKFEPWEQEILKGIAQASSEFFSEFNRK